MGIYSNPNAFEPSLTSEISEAGVDLMCEMFAFSDIYRMDDTAKKALLESPEMKEQRDLLEEKGLINKSTVVRLSKSADADRRQQIAVYALAREANDPLWKQFCIAQQKKIAAREAMNRKYHSKATITARVGQRAYLKKNPMTNIVLR